MNEVLTPEFFAPLFELRSGQGCIVLVSLFNSFADCAAVVHDFHVWILQVRDSQLLVPASVTRSRLPSLLVRSSNNSLFTAASRPALPLSVLVLQHPSAFRWRRALIVVS